MATTFSASLSHWASTPPTCTASVSGDHTVTGTDGSFSDSATLHVTSTAPTITGFSPASGAVGATVTISGTHLSGVDSVRFNGTEATFTVVSDTKITATVPFGATTGKISVTTAAGGTGLSATAFKVKPTVSSFAPTKGPVGTSVVITGTAFTGATEVKFGSVPATTFTVDSYTQITATVPTDALTGKISVKTPGGTGTSGTNFKVTPTITGFTPTSGPVGTVVTIDGTAFTPKTVVKFGGVRATSVTFVSWSEVRATVPAGAVTGRITVSTNGGTAKSSTNFTVTR